MKSFFKRFGRLDISSFLSAFVFITLCSKSSFLYPLNDWGDVSCYFVIAKGIVNGMVPYRDLIEQKGPIIFFIYAIAVLISATSYIGVYILEVISAYLFLRISLSIIGLYVDAEKYCFVIAPTIAATVYSSYNFCHGGSVEELLLFVFAYAVYLLLRYVEKNQLPGRGEMLLWGLMAGLIFFTKFSLCIIYIAVIIFMIIWAIKRGEAALLFRNTIFFILGCILVSAGVLAYFAANNSIEYMWTNYFYNSTFSYLSDDSDFAANIVAQRITNFITAKRNILFFLGIILEIVWLCRKRKLFTLTFVIFSIATYFYLHFYVAFAQKYYGLPLCVYGILGLCFIIEIVESHNFKLTPVVSCAAFVAMIMVAFILTDNRYMILASKDSRVQNVYAKEMWSYGYDDFHMLYYGNLDQGFYVASNTLPNCRAFVTLNILGDKLINIQKQHINDKKVEFIVTYFILCDSEDYEETLEKYGSENAEIVIPFDDFSYELIDEQPQYFETVTQTVRLYKIADGR
jgi:hypothetical protein